MFVVLYWLAQVRLDNRAVATGWLPACVCVSLAPGRRNIPATQRVNDRLFHGSLGNEHFEIGVGRNIGVSGTFVSI